MSFGNRIGAGIRIFGFVYGMLNLVVCGALVMMAINAWMADKFSPAHLVFLLPLAGVFTGYWIRRNRFGWWRGLIVGINLLLTFAILFVAVFIAPQMKAVKQKKFETHHPPAASAPAARDGSD